MKLQHFGAAGTVTGSCHLLEVSDGHKYLVDFGMFQGSQELEKLNSDPIKFDPSELSAVFLTHAHLDHCGRLPALIAGGFTGPVFATKPTQDLAELVMFDSAKIARMDADVTPIYNDDDVNSILRLFRIVSYNETFETQSVSVTYKDAGHLLGSANIKITDKGTGESIVFSGDLGNMPAPLLCSTDCFSEADYVVMESTYGDKLHPKEDQYGQLADEINAVFQKRSTLLIPAFSLERTQVMLNMIKVLKIKGNIPNNIQVFLDSPMGIVATNIYKDYIEYFNNRIQNEFRNGDPFDFPGLFVTKRPGKGAILNSNSTKVIIAGSGMMSGGRIVNHAARYLPDPKNRLLIVGFQGEETLGREIVEGARVVNINGKKVNVRANVNQVRSMSAHADQEMLLNWLKAIKGFKKVVLVHGENGGPRETLKSKIKELHHEVEVFTPELFDSIDLA